MRSSLTADRVHADEDYPRPQLRREHWLELSGHWLFAYDDADIGRAQHWPLELAPFDRHITVPFPPESPASGIGETGFHPVLWYRRDVSATELLELPDGEELVLHFGAVDFRADVWIDGQHVASHEGGHTPFSLVVPNRTRASFSIVVRVEDQPEDVAQPRGKQDWQADPHVIWYHRTSGIWQPVWLESVAKQRIELVHWQADLPGAAVRARFELSRLDGPLSLEVTLAHAGELLAEQRVLVQSSEFALELGLPRQRNGQRYEELLWSPERPTLIDARIRLYRGEELLDEVHSYLGLRNVGAEAGKFWLNDRPYYVRAVLAQGYWPQSHLAAPSADALRAEVELIRALGFNTVRVHEKAEDPRFLYWADRLGLLVWAEMPSAYEFSAIAVGRSTREWLEVLRRDLGHPSIVAWVPFNESWGVQHVSHDPAQRAFVRALVQLTKALDGSRPVISNDGWEHLESDVLTVHDYSSSGAELAARYHDPALLERLGREPLAAGRRLFADDGEIGHAPIVLSEFGGISFDPAAADDSWGYSLAGDAIEFERRLRDVIGAVASSPVLAGFCYTQLTDTRQETNGLVDEHREFKLPLEVLREIIRGRDA